MRRREFIALVGGAAAWPLSARAQQARKPARIGFLPLGSPSNADDVLNVEAFRQGLREVGLIESRDVVLEIVWISGDPAQAVSELMQRGVELLVPCGSSASVAAGRQTKTIPILFISVGNPIGMELVESLSRPGGNATGFSDVLAALSGKYVDIARELIGMRATVDYLWHRRWPDGQNRYEATERAAGLLDVKLRSQGFNDVSDVNDAMKALKESGAVAVIIQPSPFTYQQRSRIIDLATAQGLATIHGFPVAGRDGALVAFGPDYADIYRRAGGYVDQILKGAKPADLPVQEPVKFHMVVNLKTAKALGFTIPAALIARADEVIE